MVTTSLSRQPQAPAVTAPPRVDLRLRARQRAASRTVHRDPVWGLRRVVRAVATVRRRVTRARLHAAAQGQAYCGPAHGRRWDVDPDEPTAAVTVTGAAPGPVCYRLACDPRTLRPARDPSGRYVYVPVRYDLLPERHAAPAVPAGQATRGR